jgi:predicted metallopeptidase
MQSHIRFLISLEIETSSDVRKDVNLTLDYVEAPDVKKLADEIADSLDLFHIVPQFLYCYRSKGSESKRTIARIHGLGKVWQEALRRPPTYVIEVISERYDKLSDEEKEKTLIHELLHIPKGFSGGFRPHKGYIDKKRIEQLHHSLLKQRSLKSEKWHDAAK